MSCNGAIRSMDNCYDKAAEICPSGYDIISSREWFGTNSTMAAMGGYNVGPIDRSLVVKCR